ncbi:glucosyltransferase [Lachnotalea glycerini]|uniref:Glucosyltransferase n=1 Tax=Lachnotalea glycerini TaxID=1763509 RepID=A0A371JF35_9FIRM|nr:glucosyltransferase [Lachnotalea glycerini]
MSKIAFFCIPAHGHTNPTLEVVKELVKRGNEVWYYSYDTMKDKIESTGARYISCDKYDIQMNLKPEDAERVGKDIAFSMEILVNTTLALDEAIIEEMKDWKPDCIVADSMAAWGKMTAFKLNIPFVSSTTTFAFNRYSSKIMKQGIIPLFSMLLSMSKAKKSIKKLRDKGYPVKGVLSMIQNDNETNTIVYTSPEFQPCAETFSDKYTFVGPSVRQIDYKITKTVTKTIYISLGTVNNQDSSFFRNCMLALKDSDMNVIMSVGDVIDMALLGNIPANFQVERSVNQIEVLQQVDLFVTHCGMNSVNEALYYKVPLILFPQTSEQGGVAYRVNELGAGVYLKDNSVSAIKEAVKEILNNPIYKKNAEIIAKDFHKCGGPKLAANKILEVAGK